MVEEINCPSAIATTYTGKTLRGLRELRDIIFPKDPSVRVETANYPDVLLIYTSLPKEDLRNLLISKKPSVVARIVIADKCLRVSRENYFQQIIENSLELISSKTNTSINFYVDCISRGRIIESCRVLEIEIGRIIKERGLGKVSFKNPSKVLKIEVVDDIVIIALINPKEDRLRKHV